MDKNRFIKYASTGLLFFMLPVSAYALDELEGTQADRFTLEQVDGKFVRLDKKTGQVSVCEFSAENLICRMAADDRNALVDELTDLQNRIATLEDDDVESPFDMDAGEIKPKKDIPSGDENASDGAQKKSTGKKLDEAENKSLDHAMEKEMDDEFEDALKYSNKVMRRFFDVMKKLRTDFENDY